MRRHEVWWAELPPPVGRRPVILVSRERAIQVRQSVTVAQITRTVRGIATEVPLGPEEGLPKHCAANADVLMTVPKSLLRTRVCGLTLEKSRALDRALRFALGLD